MPAEELRSEDFDNHVTKCFVLRWENLNDDTFADDMTLLANTIER